MRRLLMLGWLLVPLAAAAFHYGPGQTGLKYDEADGHLRDAEVAVAEGRFADAVEAYDAGLAALPPGAEETARRVTLERAKARMFSGGLPLAHDELFALQEELADRPLADPLRRETERALAHSRHYLVWLMRLEGRPEQEWRPEIESARQMLRALTESTGESPEWTTVAATAATAPAEMTTLDLRGSDVRPSSPVAARPEPETATTLAEDLEATIRLERIGLDELQAIPLPKQCRSCCSKESKCCGNCKKPGKKKTGGKSKPQDARGASGGPPPDDSGS